MSNQRQIATAGIIYAKNNDNFLPLDGRNWSNDYAHPRVIRASMFEALDLPTHLYACPSKGISTHYTEVSTQGDVHVPDLVTHYLMLWNGQNSKSNWEVDWQSRPVKASQGSSEHVMITGQLTYWAPTGELWFNHRVSKQNFIGTNQAFADGHAEWVVRERFPMDSIENGNDYEMTHGGTFIWGRPYWSSKE